MKRTMCSALIVGLFGGLAYAGAPAANPAAEPSEEVLWASFILGLCSRDRRLGKASARMS